MQTDIDFNILSIQHIAERMPDPGWKLNVDADDSSFIMGVVLDGQAEYIIGNRIYSLSRGDLILMPPGTARTARSLPEDPWHFISISCRLTFADNSSRQEVLSLPLQFSRLPDAFFRKCLELSHIWSGKRTGYSLKCKSLILELFYDLIQHQESQKFQPSHYDRIVRVQEYIQSHYTEEFQAGELASLCGFSESHFRRLFHAVTGMSCIQYVNLIKIDMAKNLLLSGTANVSEAAALTGFTDIYYFSRVFKRITGHPPSSFKT